MRIEELVEYCDKVMAMVQAERGHASYTTALEFLRKHAGSDSAYYLGAVKVEFWADPHEETLKLLKSFREYVRTGIFDAMSIVERAKLDTVSDYLQQAESLLNEGKSHPAAAVVIIGASLEEFLRVWCERENIIASGTTTTIDGYAKALLAHHVLNKQDMKDITAWAGHRNSAAHGHWSLVEDRSRIANMLEGVNLFMRRYS